MTSTWSKYAWCLIRWVWRQKIHNWPDYKCPQYCDTKITWFLTHAVSRSSLVEYVSHLKCWKSPYWLGLFNTENKIVRNYVSVDTVWHGRHFISPPLFVMYWQSAWFCTKQTLINRDGRVYLTNLWSCIFLFFDTDTLGKRRSHGSAVVCHLTAFSHIAITIGQNIYVVL